MQEALLAAALQWPDEGVPDNPRGWLIQVAARRMTDHLRAELARRRRETVVAMEAPAASVRSPTSRRASAGQSAQHDPDDTLILLFMCCHPALTRPSAIALTLRAVGGLTTAEIASAFLVPEATMAQRISRAKQRIKIVWRAVPHADRPGAGRTPRRRAARALPDLQRGLHEQHRCPRCMRSDLSNEAIRLTRAVHHILPPAAEGAGEVAGLLALMLLTDARRAARTGPDGELIPLAEQDRGAWDREAIAEGVALVNGHALPRLDWCVSAAGRDRRRSRRGGARGGHGLAADPRLVRSARSACPTIRW